MKIAINGYGRIGRSFVRALAEREAAGRPPQPLVATAGGVVARFADSRSRWAM